MSPLSESSGFAQIGVNKIGLKVFFKTFLHQICVYPLCFDKGRTKYA
jgi:hypothetical protein